MINLFYFLFVELTRKKECTFSVRSFLAYTSVLIYDTCWRFSRTLISLYFLRMRRKRLYVRGSVR